MLQTGARSVIISDLQEFDFFFEEMIKECLFSIPKPNYIILNFFVQNHWVDFNQSWNQASLVIWNLSLFI